MRREGIALVLVLATLVILSTLGTVIFVRTLGEIRHSRADAGIVQALMLARGAAGVAGAFLGGPLRDRLSDLVTKTENREDCWAYSSNYRCFWEENHWREDPNAFDVAFFLNERLAKKIQSEVVSPMFCGRNLAPSGLDAQVSLWIHFAYVHNSPCSWRSVRLTLPGGRLVEGSPRTPQNPAALQTYALPFAVMAEATVKEYRRRLLLQGEYRFTTGRSSFARYALFTHVPALPNGTEVWFTDQTLYDGPVHTNGHFRFHGTPWFGGEVTSAGCTDPRVDRCNGQIEPGAYFYDTGFRSVSQMTDPARPRFGGDAPQFNGGVDWKASFIPLPQSEGYLRGSHGSLFFYDIEKLKLYMKCLDAYDTEVECTTPGATKWQYIEVTACTDSRCSATRTVVYRYGEDRLLFQQGVNGVFSPFYKRDYWGRYQVRFNGVIYTNGEVRSLEGPARRDPDDPNSAPPALAEFAKITISAPSGVKISTDLKYERPPCTSFPTRNPDGSVTPARCTDLGARNVLGVYSQRGDILISQNAPKDLHIHASLMSARGIVGVEGYNSIPAKGNVHLLGGIIQYYYGAFGTFNANTGQLRTGYGRAFAYDPRFQKGLAPPLFPNTSPQSRVVSVSFFIFGQKEQDW